MEISELTFEQVTPVIQAVVAEYGEDYVYPLTHCLYQKNGSPSCLIGHVLDRLGVEYNPTWEFNSIEELGNYTDVALALSTAQAAQDVGVTWGGALSRYMESKQKAEEIEKVEK